jgi:hypothetical protein
MDKPRFERSDTWIFLCIPLEGPGTDRKSILGTADYINHAIPTEQELEGALSRGVEAGLLETKNDRYFFAEKYRKQIKKIFKSSKNIFKVWDELEKFLNTF